MSAMSGTPSKPLAAAPVPEYSYSFRIVDLLYVVALFASAFAVFGLYGILAGGAVVLFWAAVYANSSQRKIIVGASAVLLGAVCLLWPSYQPLRPPQRRAICGHNLRQIAIALHHYQATWGEFPPVYTSDKDGRPMHSWRVLILPFMEESHLYEQYDFSESWDGPNNSKLLSKMPKIYRCASHPSDGRDPKQCTSYLAVVGNSANGKGAGSAALGNVTGDARNPIMLIEDSAPHVPWTEPRDWSVEQALEHLTSDDPEDRGAHQEENYFFEYVSGRNAAWADGGVGFYFDNMGRGRWGHALTIDGADAASDLLGIPQRPQVRAVKLANWLAAGSFLVLSILPLPWVFRKRAIAGASK
jgi:hypothetical protein